MSLFHLRTTAPNLLTGMIAQRRVHRGLRWLNEHARVGWHRNMFEPQADGTSRYRVDSRDNQGTVLALAFEHEPRFAPEGCCVSDFHVIRHYDLEKRAELLGFRESRIKEGFYITGRMLDQLWRVVVVAYGFSPNPHCHGIIRLDHGAETRIHQARERAPGFIAQMLRISKSLGNRS